MNTLKKIVVLSLVLPIIFLSSETCFVPLAMAQTAPMGISEAHSSIHVQNTHGDVCSNVDSDICGIDQSGNFKGCLFSCENSLSKMLFSEEVLHMVRLVVFHHISNEFNSLSIVQGASSVRAAPPDSLIQRDALLSVSKKE